MESEVCCHCCHVAIFPHYGSISAKSFLQSYQLFKFLKNCLFRALEQYKKLNLKIFKYSKILTYWMLDKLLSDGLHLPNVNVVRGSTRLVFSEVSFSYSENGKLTSYLYVNLKCAPSKVICKSK
jgi:hypothetical protein